MSTREEKRKPSQGYPCLACWLERVYGYKGKCHSGYGLRCPKT